MRAIGYTILADPLWGRTVHVKTGGWILAIHMPENGGNTPTEEEVRAVADVVVESYRPQHPDEAISMQYTTRDKIITPQEI